MRKYESFAAGMRRYAVRELIEDLCGETGWCAVWTEGGELLTNSVKALETEHPNCDGAIRRDYELALEAIEKVVNPPEYVMLVSGIAGNSGVTGVFAFENEKKAFWWALTRTLANWSFGRYFENDGFDFAKLRKELPMILKNRAFTDGENSVDVVKFSDLKRVIVEAL